jgi:hypothetical protein
VETPFVCSYCKYRVPLARITGVCLLRQAPATLQHPPPSETRLVSPIPTSYQWDFEEGNRAKWKDRNSV